MLSPSQFQHMPLSRMRQPFNHPEWLYEIKHDGFRALAYVNDGECKLVSRTGYVYKRFVELAEGSAENREDVLRQSRMMGV